MFRKFAFALLALTILLAACRSRPTGGPAATPSPLPPSAPATQLPTSPAPTPFTLTDGLGRQVTLNGFAQRVVSLTPATTEILFAVGAASQVVGRDMFSDYPEEAKAIADIGGSMGEYNLEAILVLQPDLVLAGGINPPELVASLEELGLTVFFVSNPATLEEMFGNLQQVAILTGHEAEAEVLVDSLKARVAAVDEKIMPLSYRPSVFYELDASADSSKPWTSGPGTFVDLMIDRAGGFNIGGSLSGAWAQISLEELVVQNPSIIILGDAAYGVTPESVKARPGWEALAAVQNDKIYPFDDNLVSRPGPRLVDGLEALAKLLHPDLFK